MKKSKAANKLIKKEYPYLWIVIIIFQIIGVISILPAGLIFLTSISAINSDGATAFMGIAYALMTLIAPVVLFATSELIKIFIKIELNTRKNNDEGYETI